MGAQLAAVVHMGEATLHEVRGIELDLGARVRGLEETVQGVLKKELGELKAGQAEIKALLVGLSGAVAALAARKPLPLRAAHVTAQEAKDAGYAADAMRAAGYSAEEMGGAGYSAKELQGVGYSVAELRAHFTLRDLMGEGFMPLELFGAGFTVDELRAAKSTAYCKMIGPVPECRTLLKLSLEECRAAGFSGAALLAAGFTWYCGPCPVENCTNKTSCIDEGHVVRLL
jgi:intracellular multiplication protein IcmE